MKKKGNQQSIKPLIFNNNLEGLKLIPYKDLGDKFRNELKLHKYFISHFIKNSDEKIIPAIISSGEELALVYSDFKCEACETEDNLQNHHMIQKNIKPYVNSTKYIVQRYYWSNIIILCNSCHADFHMFSKKKFIAESMCISKQKINKVRESYKLKSLELTK